MNPMLDEHLAARTRRHFFKECGVGLGAMALAQLLGADSADAAGGRRAPPRQLHHPARAKRVIYLFMAGAPSQLDLFDPKPTLSRLDGKPVPAEVVKDQRYAFIQPNAALMGSRFRFARYGQCGAELSSVLPHLAKVVDDIAIVRSVHTDQFNHAPAQLFINTGGPLPGRPSMGSWVSYGLGSENQDLPAFVVLQSAGTTSAGASLRGAGFLPTVHQGVPFRSTGEPILNVANPAGIDRRMQREALDVLRDLNRRQLEAVGDPEIATRIEAYELAYRMQTAAPELMSIDDEPKSVLEDYGVEPGKTSFANNCLLARRLVERGVRFVQLYHGGWDHHSNVEAGLIRKCASMDRPAAALLRDLKDRGLLDDTLVVWGGEFGRTPMVETSAVLNRQQGRDHHPQAFTVWLAGGGVRGGMTLGKTDDLGFHIAEDPVHVHDLQATILHLLGFDHERLTYRFRGRDFRLTDVFGDVVTPLLA
jgi:hypothetical protein